MPMDPLDEYPIHQVPMSMRYVATSDKNVYDRCIFQALDHSGELELLTGLGVYPNVGIIDAYVTLRQGDRQWAVQCSGLRPDDKLAQEVGPYRIEVLEPFKRLRLVCDGDEHGIGMDLLWESDFDVMEEPQHLKRMGEKVLLDACRYAQVGTFSGELRFDDRTVEVESGGWTGTRDRSWGIRPVGGLELPIAPRIPTGLAGSYWVWMPIRFDDFAIHVIVEESADGTRTTNFATRVWPLSTGRPAEQLGWPEVEVHYRSGTRHPEAATVRLRTPMREEVVVEVETLTGVPLSLGCGYNFNDPDWGHGRWKGEKWVQGVFYDHTSSEIKEKAASSMTDHLARATCNGQTGYGIFEHGNSGAHLPTGFPDATTMAP